jgi:hypothetical protein
VRAQLGRVATIVATFPSLALDRLMDMERLRRIALVILLAGWMVPALLAQKAGERAARTAPPPVARSHLKQISGLEPPPAPADRAVTMLRTVAAVWFLIAVVYASVLTVRFRRTLIS